MITICKSCGYPVIPQMRTCPNCNVTIGKEEQEKKILTTLSCPNCGAEFPNNGEHYCPECGHSLLEPEPGPPIPPNPDETKRIIPVCTLRPITLAGESRQKTQTLEDKGNGVKLSRENTMPSDTSIDAKNQAVIWFNKGEWFIEDMREDGRSTYVHAGTGIKLTDGDIIRMGEREFEFNIKKE